MFDIADTEDGANSRRPQLWRRREECYDAVSAALEKRFGPAAGDDTETKLADISKRLALEYWNDRREDILDAVPGNFLEEYDALNAEVSFRRAASVSMAYAMMSRCSPEPEKYFRHDDFRNVFNFNAARGHVPAGNAVNESAEQALREIEKALRTCAKIKLTVLSGAR